MGHLGLHHLGEGLESEQVEGLDQCDHDGEIHKLRVARQVLVGRGVRLALGRDLEYGRHEAAPFLVRSPVCATNRPTVREVLRYFS